MFVYYTENAVKSDIFIQKEIFMKEKVLLIYNLVLCLLSLSVIISRCKIFHKAGHKWWAGLIPIYAELKTLFIFWKKRWLPIYLAAEFAEAFVQAIGRVFINNWTLLFGCLAAPVFVYTIVLLGIAYYLFMIRLNVNMALHFGKSKEFGMAMAVFPSFLWPVIAFGKSKYIKDAPEWTITRI